MDSPSKSSDAIVMFVDMLGFGGLLRQHSDVHAKDFDTAAEFSATLGSPFADSGVLLMRARQGMVIFVPDGEEADATRRQEFYNDTYRYLVTLGLDIA